MRRQLVSEYDVCLNEVHGVAGRIRYDRYAEATRFLAWCNEHAWGESAVAAVGVRRRRLFQQWRDWSA